MDRWRRAEKAAGLGADGQGAHGQAGAMAQDATALAVASTGGASEPFVFLLTVFVLAVFIGYYVVWSVTPALHSPLMAITNAISSVIIVGALIAAGPTEFNLAKIFGLCAVVLASNNIFGGFIVTRRMLQMFRQKR